LNKKLVIAKNLTVAIATMKNEKDYYSDGNTQMQNVLLYQAILE